MLFSFPCLLVQLQVQSNALCLSMSIENLLIGAVPLDDASENLTQAIVEADEFAGRSQFANNLLFVMVFFVLFLQFLWE